MKPNLSDDDNINDNKNNRIILKIHINNHTLKAKQKLDTFFYLEMI